MTKKRTYWKTAALLILILHGSFIAMSGQSCYELVWNDEFNYTGLPDTSLWNYETGGDGWGNNELQYYTSERPENARVENGILIIEARREDFSGNHYTSARLTNYSHYDSLKYGKIEARIKLPYGQGIWPAFWTLGNSIRNGISWPACGEIDIMEMIGGGEGRDDVVHGTVHWSDAGDNHAQYGDSYQLDEGIFNDEFHVFTVEWTETEIIWFIDNEQYNVIDITPGHLSEFHEEFFIILNVAVGGNWPGSPDASTVFPQKMEVDYVRVYQKGKTPHITGDTSVVKAQKNIPFSVVESDDFSYLWSTTGDVEITEGQGTHSVLVNWGCDTGSVLCHLETLCDTYDLALHAGLREPEISGNNRVEVNSSNLVYSVVETEGASYAWSLPDDAGFNGNTDSNTVSVNWGYTSGELKVNITNVCGNDSALLPITAVIQEPYPETGSPHPIPGIIESVSYDSGGEGIAYHDTEPENLGTGSRQDEGVDTESNDGGENVGWIEAGEWLEYTVEVDPTNSYDVELRIASQDGGGEMIIYFNNEARTQVISIPSTGSWNNFSSVYLRDIQINTTDTIMKVEIVSGGFNLGRMRFEDWLPSAVRTTEDDDITVYPTIATDWIRIDHSRYTREYFLTDMAGRTVMRGKITPGGSIDLSGISSGTYMVNILTDTSLVNRRIIKL
jgi:beta-glucanase (GH16 family)